MLKKISLAVVAFAMLCLLQACSLKKAQQTQGRFKNKSAAELLAALEKNHIQYRTFSARAALTIVEGSGTRSADARIRMVRDSTIWLSVSLFGIEGVRALLTPDSVKVINRLDGTYISEGYNYFQKKYNVPLTFFSLQDILIGNLPDRNAIGFRASTDSTGYTLEKGMDGSTLSYLLDGTTFQTQKIAIEELREQRFFRLFFADYEPVQDVPTTQIANTRAIITRTDKGDFQLGMELKAIKLNQPFKTDFEIPKNYQQTKM